MATPCISPPKLHRDGISNYLHPRFDSTSRDDFSKNCSARHVHCDGVAQCRFAYATWCPVCKDQENSKKIYHGSRRRSKSEGMEADRSKDYYTKATNSEAYHYQSGISCVKRRQLSRKLVSDDRPDNCDYSIASTNKEQIGLYTNKLLPGCSCHSKFDNKGKTMKRICKPCENHFEPNRPAFDIWNHSHNELGYHRNESEVMPLHERYYYEVELLRNKLHKLRESPVDSKRVKHLNEIDYSNNSVEVGLKRPRDVSPSNHSSSSVVRKLLPSVPPNKSSTCKGALLPRAKSVLSSESATSVSSDSEYNDSGCEEEDIKDNNEVDLEEGEGAVVDPGKIHPALRPSLFSHVPPYIRFSTHDVKGATLPPSIQKLLKWKLSTITPVVVRRTVLNSNFKLVRKSNEWCGTWGKHMKSLCFKTLREYQKINHFPGTFQIGRKDRLWKNLFRLNTKFGKKEFGFIPKTYVLPQDNKLLRAAWEKNCGKETWIVKPPASARGTGIKVIHKWTQIPKKCPLVVQKYILNPYLINGSKFDLRLYVLVTSINPLRIYMYDNGLVRFASVKYSNEFNSLADRYMHLTNYSINKLSSQYTQNEDASACQGHKWSLQALWTYLREERKVDVKTLWKTLVDLVIKTIISGESSISQLSAANLASRYCSYELFGIDVLLDHELRPWLLEVNISPSLHSSSPLDLAVKGPMVQDLMNIAGYQIPNKLSAQVQQGLAESLGLDSNLCFDRRLYTTALSHDERLKHVNFQQVECRADYLDTIVQDLTPDDVRHLVQYEDELTQIGNFQKIFPTTETYEYHHFFEAPRYYNMLFDAWEVKQSRDRTGDTSSSDAADQGAQEENSQNTKPSKWSALKKMAGAKTSNVNSKITQGIALLQSLCQKQVHLDVTQIPPKRTKVSMSPSGSGLRSPDLLDEEGLEVAEDFHSALPEKIKEKCKVKVGTILRAARLRNGKPNLVSKPYPRSTVIARRPVKCANRDS